jgi:hypothetical protein
MEILQYPDHSDLTRVFFPRLLSALDLLSHPQREIVV